MYGNYTWTLEELIISISYKNNTINFIFVEKSKKDATLNTSLIKYLTKISNAIICQKLNSNDFWKF